MIPCYVMGTWWKCPTIVPFVCWGEVSRSCAAIPTGAFDTTLLDDKTAFRQARGRTRRESGGNGT